MKKEMMTNEELIIRLVKEKYDLEEDRDIWKNIAKSCSDQIEKNRKEIDRLRNSKKECECVNCEDGGASNE